MPQVPCSADDPNFVCQAARGEQAAKSHYAHLLGVIEDLTRRLRVSNPQCVLVVILE
jgi:hypothetical protein